MFALLVVLGAIVAWIAGGKIFYRALAGWDKELIVQIFGIRFLASIFWPITLVMNLTKNKNTEGYDD